MKLSKCAGVAVAVLAAASLSACANASRFNLGGGLTPLPQNAPTSVSAAQNNNDANNNASNDGGGANTNNGGGNNAGGGNNSGGGDDNGGGDDSGAPRKLSSLLDPVTDGAGKVVGGLGRTVTAVGDGLPGSGLLERVVSGVGDKADGLGSVLQNDGVGGLPLIGGATQSVLAGADTLAGDLATISVLDQAVGGASPALGVGLLGQNTPQGSVATIGVLSGGDVAQVALGQNPLSTTVSQVLPATLANVGAVVEATPLGALAPVSNVLNGALVADAGLGAGVSLPGVQAGAGAGAVVTPPPLPVLPSLPIVGGLFGH